MFMPSVQFSLFKTMILSKRICTAIYVAINERFGPLYPRKLAFTINLMLKTTKNTLNLENFP